MKQDNYTPEQQRFITNPYYRSVLLAPPGSGKTHTLMGRIKWLMRTAPAPLAAMTFTNRAARELEQRIAADPDLAPYTAQMWAGTFHSYCIQVLRRFPRLSELYGLEPDFAVAPRPEGKTEQAVMACTLGHQLRQLGKDLGYKETLTKIAKRLEYDTDFESIWTQRLIVENIADYEFVMRAAAEILRRDDCDYRPVHVIADEVQDTGLQERMTLESFATFARTISVVGDPDQSIYGFRGAFPAWCESALKLQGYQYFRLTRNFRSGDKIIELLNRVFPDRNQPVVRPATVQVVSHADETAEADWIADQVTARIAVGLPPGDIAVIARRHGRYATAARVLAARGIPVESPNETVGLIRSKPFSDVLAVLRSLANPECGPALLHAALVLGAPDGIVNAIRLASLELKVPVSVYLPDSSFAPERPYRDLLAIIKTHGEATDLYAISKALIAAQNLVRDITGAVMSPDLDEAVDRYISGFARSIPECEYDTAPLSTFVHFVDTCRPQDLIEDGADAVVCSSVHGVKGLEYHTVFLLGLERGEMPRESDSDQAEEKRLFYVAASRAKDELFLSRVMEKEKYVWAGFTVAAEPSPYLDFVQGMGII